MAVDTKIEKAIRQAVMESGQSEELARYILAWVTAVGSGNEQIHEEQAALRHLELLYKYTVIDELQEDTP